MQWTTTGIELLLQSNPFDITLTTIDICTTIRTRAVCDMLVRQYPCHSYIQLSTKREPFQWLCGTNWCIQGHKKRV
jgi:hypothetical protein